MHLASSLDCITSLPVPEDWTGIQRDLDPAWITEVATSLDLALPTPAGGPTASRSAVSKARSRLGDKPLAWLFERTADHWAHASADRHRWRGLALYGLDGTTLRVPDSDPNSSFFGYASGGDRGDSGYSLQHAGTERHWLVPAKKNTKWHRLERFGRGDELVEIVTLYHERWEVELGIGEVKTDMLDATHQPPRRPGRSSPRAVKVKMSSYPEKRRTAPKNRSRK